MGVIGAETCKTVEVVVVVEVVVPSSSFFKNSLTKYIDYTHYYY
jgi:hypothetical protein